MRWGGVTEAMSAAAVAPGAWKMVMMMMAGARKRAARYVGST